MAISSNMEAICNRASVILVFRFMENIAYLKSVLKVALLK